MKEMKKKENLTDRDWQELAGYMSEETGIKSEKLKQFIAEDSYNTATKWKELKEMNDNEQIDVEQAWDKVMSRISGTENNYIKDPDKTIILRRTLMKIAAVALILLSIGAAAVYIVKTDALSRKIIASTGNDERNLKVTLPDGSNVFLNRNTKLSYHSNFGRSNRNVSLEGEAFFEIAPDKLNPFTVDAGKAMIKVVGTSFNVITSNDDAEVEVFVETGHVMLYDESTDQNIMLDPGFVGTLSQKSSEKKLNDNPNYMAWNRGLLKYDGQTLDVVFHDLKRVYNMEIIADDQEILELPWAITIDNQSQDTIIRLICASFILSYTKDGNVYHLRKK
jgi:ferric-dicitrate binding protein FerR (iron transport regulator)